MTARNAPDGNSHTENPRMRFDGGAVASAVTPRRGSPLCKRVGASAGLAFLAASISAGSAVAAPGQFCSVVKSEGSPVIDGSRDAVYDEAYPIDGLSHPRLLSLARERTSAKFLHDGTCLYGFIRCEDPNVANMPAWSAKRDDSTLWKGDAIELFFVAKDGLKHFIISPTGGVYDAAGHPDDANTWMFDVKWNSGIKWAVSRDDASWSVEFSLPLADIPGRDMAFNLVRDSPDARKCASWSRLADSAKWIYPADKTESTYGRIRFIDSAPGGFDFKCPPMIRPDKENYCLVRLAKDMPTKGFKLAVQGKDQKPWGSFASGRFGWTYNLDMKAKGDKDAVFTVEDGGELLFRQVSAIPAGYIMIRPSNLARGKLYLNSNRGLKAKLNWDCKHNYEGARMSNGGQIEKPFDIVFRCPPGVKVVSDGVRQEGEFQVQHQRYAYLVPDYFSTQFATTLPAGTKGKISYSAKYEDGAQGAQDIDFEVIDVGVPPKLKKFYVGHYNLYPRSLEDARAWAETGVNSFTMRGYADEDAALVRSLTANGFKVVRGGYFWPGAVAGHSPWAVWTREDETARAKDINGRDIPLGAGLQISPSYRGRFFVESCRKEAEFCRKAGIYRFNFDIEDYIQKKGELGDFRPETIAYFKRRWAERYPGEPVPEPKVFERDPAAHPREHEAWVGAKCELWADFFREMKRLLSEGIGREVIFTDWSFNVFQTVEKRNHSLRNADFYRIFDIREHGFYSSIDRDVRQLEQILVQFRQTFPGVKLSLSWCPSPVRYSLGRDSSDYYWSTMPAIDDEIVYSMYEAATFGCKGVFTFKAPMVDMEFHRQFIAALNVLAKVEDIVVDGESRSLETNFPNDAEVHDKFFGRFDTWRNQRRVFCRANTLGGRTLISVSEYRNRGPMDVVVKFPHCGTVTVTDLESGEHVATLAEGDDALKVSLRDRRCRLLLAE